MEKRAVPDDVQRFILVSVPSVPYLEAMLLIRNEPSLPWDKGLLARRLYMGEKAAADLLAELHAAGVLAPDALRPDCYRYGPPGELETMLARVAHAYAGDLIGITHLIHTKTAKKAFVFADAFKWRKDR